MSDADVAVIGRDLARALSQRARTRNPDDQKLVLHLQTMLCAEVAREGTEESIERDSQTVDS